VKAFSIFGRMRVFLQLALILGICYAGDLIHDYTGIPVPGNILGMLILLLLLCLKIVKLDQIREVSDFFLKRLSFFFLPPAIGLMLVGDDVKSQWPLLLFLCIVITVVTMVTTGWTVQLLSKKNKNKN
jgi:holin-like protein